MVLYFLDFLENIRFSKTLREYQEQPYPLEKTTNVFLDPPKKACNIQRTFIEQPGNFPIFSIPGTLFQNILRNFNGNFSEYTGNISRECSTNIPRTYICPVGNDLVRKVAAFVKSSMFDVWHGSTISLQFLKNLKVNRLMNIEYQHISNSVTEGYELLINMDHNHGLYSIFQSWTMK